MPVGISFSEVNLSVFFDETHKQADGMRLISFEKKSIIVMYESRIPHYIGVPVVWLLRSQGEYNEGHI
jgi:hypothetical protein